MFTRIPLGQCGSLSIHQCRHSVPHVLAVYMANSLLVPTCLTGTQSARSVRSWLFIKINAQHGVTEEQAVEAAVRLAEMSPYTPSRDIYVSSIAAFFDCYFSSFIFLFFVGFVCV